MRAMRWSERLWGERAKLSYLLLAAALLLFAFLGAREIWTQEHRWADIVSGMFFRHDFLHPFLGEVDYYDKPLLSYWLIAAFSVLNGHVSTWAMRLPSALAGLLAVWSIYRLGLNLRDKRLGLLAGWLLVTTFYFLFWARTSSADMLNMAGALFAVSWYVEKKASPSFGNYTVFFLILALASLCKGLVAAVVAALVILPDLFKQQEWKKHLRLSCFLGMIPAAILYVLPFWASNYFSSHSYGENGLYEVYRENILRYFQPFDHKGPIYTYFIYLPLYLMPWAFFFVPALFSLKSRWSNMNWQAKWMVWAVALLFLFFTLSGSRRNYYVLPIVPFAILLTADWILATGDFWARRAVWAGRVVAGLFLVLFLNFAVFQPFYYAEIGVNKFAALLKKEATQIKPWQQWQFVMLDAESKVRFYLQLPPNVKMYSISGDQRSQQTQVSLMKAWPVLSEKPKNVIILTRKRYVPLLKDLLPQYQLVEISSSFFRQKGDAAVAFVPLV